MITLPRLETIGVAALLVFVALTEIFQISVTHYLPFADKLVHMIAAFGGIYFLSMFISVRKSVLLVFLFLTGVEFIQHYMPSREASVGDVIANSVGIVFAWWYLKFKKA